MENEKQFETTENGERIFKVPESNVETLRGRIEKLNKRAAKLGCAANNESAMKKPRKRRTQTLAEKGVGVKLYPWTVGTLMGEVVLFTFACPPNVLATLTLSEGKWLMAVQLERQHYRGERPTLEAAYKAVANLIYKHAREYWLKMDGRAVTEHFEDFLKGEI